MKQNGDGKEGKLSQVEWNVKRGCASLVGRNHQILLAIAVAMVFFFLVAFVLLLSVRSPSSVTCSFVRQVY